MRDEHAALVARARERQARARGVMAALRLLEEWGKVGEPVLVGATRTGLTVSPDIDMEVYTQSPQIPDGFAVVARLAQVPGVCQVRFANELEGPDQGLYWQLRYRDPSGLMWKVDTWLVAHDHPQAHWAERFADALVATLTDDTRAAILRVKEALQGQADARGIDIYRAVLEGGVRDAEQFRRWQAATPSEGLIWWMPPGASGEGLP
ncbi:MAG: hypothetical protein GX557_08170 [Chloroflexi bacterium]|nr:hypothetical protein [Chloroflexota bacterium]